MCSANSIQKTLMMLKGHIIVAVQLFLSDCMVPDGTMTLERFPFFVLMQMIRFLNSQGTKRGTKLIIMQLCCIAAPLNSFYFG